MTLLLLVACGTPSGAPKDTADTGDTAEAAVPVVFGSEERWGPHDDWEPAIAADRSSAWVYQATTRATPSPAEVLLRVSSDGGATFGEESVISDSYSTFDPQLAVAAETGCVYVTLLGGESGWTTFVRSSCDHGATWSDEVSIAPEGWTTDHGWLLVSPSGDDVYVGFNAAEPGEEKESGKGFVAVSHDGGASFAQVHVAGDGTDRYWFEEGAAMAPDGTVYFANVSYSMDYAGAADLVLWRSVDGGASFDTATVASSQEPADCAWADGCYFGFFGAQSSVAVDSAGAVMFLYSANEAAGAPMSMLAAFSPGGASWSTFSDPVSLSSVGENNFPTAEAGIQPGDFRVAWQGNDGSDDPKTWNTWYQATADGGASWFDAPIRLSDGGADAAAGANYKRDVGYAFPYGDYMDLTVDGDGKAIAIWGEGPNWTGPGGTWWVGEE